MLCTMYMRILYYTSKVHTPVWYVPYAYGMYHMRIVQFRIIEPLNSSTVQEICLTSWHQNSRVA